MGKFKVGDMVARKSYGLDILFKVVDVKKNGCEDDLTLKGITCRIEADAPESDLALQSDQCIREYIRNANNVIEQKCRQMGAKRKSGIFS
jgi:spore coat assembly protein